MHFETHLGIRSASVLSQFVFDILTPRGVRRNKLFSMPENVSTVYRNLKVSLKFLIKRFFSILLNLMSCFIIVKDWNTLIKALPIVL